MVFALFLVRGLLVYPVILRPVSLGIDRQCELNFIAQILEFKLFGTAWMKCVNLSFKLIIKIGSCRTLTWMVQYEHEHSAFYTIVQRKYVVLIESSAVRSKYLISCIVMQTGNDTFGSMNMVLVTIGFAFIWVLLLSKMVWGRYVLSLFLAQRGHFFTDF